VQFALTEWLAGKATVIVDDTGDVTLVGEIAPPAEVCLFEQQDYIKPLFRIEARAAYGVPVVGNVFLFANIGMEALAKLGPGKLHDITLSGTYSTKPEVAKSFSLAGTLTISAFAGLRLRAEGGAGVEIADHDIKAGVGVNGLAGVKGYVSARPAIGMREVGDPKAGKKTEFYVKGHLEIAAQPFLGLSGDLFVELDSPWWSPAPDKKWTWPLGQLEYPLPGEFGIGADVDYVFGSPNVPDVKFGEVSFDSNKFITDLTNDHVPPKAKGEQDKPGTWKEGDAAAPAPGEGQGKVTAGAAGGAAAGQAKPDSALASAKAKAEEKGKKVGPGDVAGTDLKMLPPEEKMRYAKGMKAANELLSWAQGRDVSAEELQKKAQDVQTTHGFKKVAVRQDPDEWILHYEYNPSGDLKKPKKTQKGGGRCELRPYGGSGGGHHIPAKRAFQGAPNYDPNSALAIPRAELDRLNISHGQITGGQAAGYTAVGTKGDTTLSWDDIEKVEIWALEYAGMERGMAVDVVERAISALRRSGVKRATRIPWVGPLT
jgi:hypothetical protein